MTKFIITALLIISTALSSIARSPENQRFLNALFSGKEYPVALSQSVTYPWQPYYGSVRTSINRGDSRCDCWFALDVFVPEDSASVSFDYRVRPVTSLTCSIDGVPVFSGYYSYSHDTTKSTTIKIAKGYHQLKWSVTLGYPYENWDYFGKIENMSFEGISDESPLPEFSKRSSSLWSLTDGVSNDTITIENVGAETFVLNSLDGLPAQFHINESFSEISPGQTKQLAFSFQPVEETCHNGNLSMLTNVGNISIPINAITYDQPPIQNPAPGKLASQISDYDAENVVIFGPMNYDDNYTLNKLQQVKSLDLRGTEFDMIFNGGVNNLYKLEHIFLPASLKYIDETWSFKHWDRATKTDVPYDIKTITCMAPEPPQPMTRGELGFIERSFQGLKEDVIVYVPAQYLPYYQADPKWNVFQILPISDDTKILSVILDNIDPDDYRGCTIELIDNTNRSQRLTVGSSREYVFHNIKDERTYSLAMRHPHGNLLAYMDIASISDQRKTELHFDSVAPLVRASVSVTDAAGTDLTGKTGISWITPYESGISGSSVSRLFTGDSVSCIISLPKELGLVYAEPDTVCHKMTASNNDLRVVLRQHASHRYKGCVVNADHSPVAGASVSINQVINGKYHWNKTAKTSSDGVFDLEVYEGPLSLEVASSKYFSVVRTDTVTSPTDLGLLVMDPCQGRKITLSTSFKENRRAGESPAVYPGYDEWRNLKFEVVNADNDDVVRNVKVEYPDIYILDPLPPATSLDLRVSSHSNAFSDFVAHCENLDGGDYSAMVEITEYGDIYSSFEYSAATRVSVLLFNGDGEICKKGTYANHVANFSNIPDGDYIIAAVESNDLLSAISNISTLALLGYADGQSYCSKRIEVRSGQICEAHFSEVPTLVDQQRVTSVKSCMSTNKNTMAVGNYVVGKSVVDILPEYHGRIDDLVWHIVVPADCELIPGTLLIGDEVATFSLDGNIASVALGDYSQPLRFCLLPRRGGPLNLNAFVSYTLDNVAYNESVGACSVEVTGATLEVLPKVPSRVVNVRGTGIAGSAVEIIDDGIMIGQASVLPNGSWQTSVELCYGRNLKAHNLHAKFTTPDGNVLYSENKRVQVNSDIPYVDKVEMIHCTPAQHITTFDFLNPSGAKKSYSYNPSYTNFTFRVWVTNLKEPGSIGDATLWVRTSDGRDVQLDLVASADNPSLLIANHQFTSSYSLPTNVAVSLNFIDESLIQSENAIGILDESMPQYYFANKTKSGNATAYDVVSTRGDFALMCCHVKYNAGEEPAEALSDIITRFGFTVLPGGESYYVAPSHAILMIKEMADGSKSAFFCYDVTESEEYRSVLSLIDSNLVRSPQTRVQYNVSTGYLEPNRSSFTLSHRVDRSMQHLIDICNQKLDCVEKIGEIDRDYAGMCLKEALNNITHMNLAVAATIISGTSEIVSSAPSNQNPVQDINDLSDMVDNLGEVAEALEGITEAARLNLEEIMRYPTECGLSKVPEYPGSGVNALIDPSGFVYEAVESNRLKDVKTTAYFKSITTDDNGNISECVSLWDATLYEQENPLFTDADGCYSWDVPAGLWQVKFEKDGYETELSDWLPVPPPQMDVNVGMTQLMNPFVDKVNAYPDSVCIRFSKYMDSHMLNTEYISVKNGDLVVSGRIELLDDEVNNNKSYASRVKFIPDAPFVPGDYILTVDSRVRSYAGCRMADDYSTTLEFAPAVTISSPAYIEVDLGESVDVAISAPGDYDNLLLKASVVGDSFITIDKDEISLTSADTESVIEITGVLPGSAVVVIEDPTLNLRTSFDVVVKNSLMKKTHEPWATIATGSAVPSGTVVYLFSATPNATIYYTSDESCPCDPDSRLTYNPSEGIIIDSDVTIKALAVADGMSESDIVELTYKSGSGSGVADAVAGSHITISPNVISHENESVTICFGEDAATAIVNIYNINGSSIANSTVGNGGRVSFAGIGKGIYILSVDTGSKQKAEKIIKLF